MNQHQSSQVNLFKRGRLGSRPKRATQNTIAYMSASNNNNLITELLVQIERLELNKTALQHEVPHLRAQVQHNKQLLESKAIAAAVVEHTEQQRSTSIRTDRYGKHIHIGNTVQTLTKGVFCKQIGRVSKFEAPWVYLIDSTGIEQQLIPQNLRVEKSLRRSNHQHKIP